MAMQRGWEAEKKMSWPSGQEIVVDVVEAQGTGRQKSRFWHELARVTVIQ